MRSSTVPVLLKVNSVCPAFAPPCEGSGHVVIIFATRIALPVAREKAFEQCGFDLGRSSVERWFHAGVAGQEQAQAGLLEKFHNLVVDLAWGEVQVQLTGFEVTRHESYQRKQIEQNGLIALQALLGDGNVEPVAITARLEALYLL